MSRPRPAWPTASSIAQPQSSSSGATQPASSSRGVGEDVDRAPTICREVYERLLRVSTMSKEAERAELHKTIWRIANDLRGSVDGWDFKTYVLGMLFYRFISENLTAYLNEAERMAGDAGLRLRRLPNAEAEFGREETVKEKGFYILPQDLFANVRERARHDENLNETLSAGVQEHRGLGGRRRQRGRPQGPLRRPRRQQRQARPDGRQAQREARQAARRDRRPPARQRPSATTTIDLFGDAYEYLMQMYASSGRQVRRRVLHAAGGRRPSRAHHRGRQDRGQQGL